MALGIVPTHPEFSVKINDQTEDLDNSFELNHSEFRNNFKSKKGNSEFNSEFEYMTQNK